MGFWRLGQVQFLSASNASKAKRSCGCWIPKLASLPLTLWLHPVRIISTPEFMFWFQVLHWTRFVMNTCPFGWVLIPGYLLVPTLSPAFKSSFNFRTSDCRLLQPAGGSVAPHPSWTCYNLLSPPRLSQLKSYQHTIFCLRTIGI